MFLTYEELCTAYKHKSSDEYQDRIILLNCNKIIETLLPTHDITVNESNREDIKQIVYKLFLYKLENSNDISPAEAQNLVGPEIIDMVRVAEEMLVFMA